MLRAQHWAARGYDLSKKRLCSTRTVRATVPPLSARVAGQGCLLGLRHGACPGAVLNTLQAIALDATRRLHPLALSSIVSTLALLGVSTLRATPAQALTGLPLAKLPPPCTLPAQRLRTPPHLPAPSPSGQASGTNSSPGSSQMTRIAQNFTTRGTHFDHPISDLYNCFTVFQIILQRPSADPRVRDWMCIVDSSWTKAPCWRDGTTFGSHGSRDQRCN